MRNTPLRSRSKSDAAKRRRAKEFGAQSALCKQTTCCACWAMEVIRDHAHGLAACPKWDPSVMRDYDWSLLPALFDDGCGTQVIDPHHEPPRGTTRASDDHDTIPLCRTHHTGGWDVVRHRLGMADKVARARFYGFLGIDWEAVRDEMRRRVAENG